MDITRLQPKDQQFALFLFIFPANNTYKPHTHTRQHTHTQRLERQLQQAQADARKGGAGTAAQLTRILSLEGELQALRDAAAAAERDHRSHTDRLRREGQQLREQLSRAQAALSSAAAPGTSGSTELLGRVREEMQALWERHGAEGAALRQRADAAEEQAQLAEQQGQLLQEQKGTIARLQEQLEKAAKRERQVAAEV